MHRSRDAGRAGSARRSEVDDGEQFSHMNPGGATRPIGRRHRTHRRRLRRRVSLVHGSTLRLSGPTSLVVGADPVLHEVDEFGLCQLRAGSNRLLKSVITESTAQFIDRRSRVLHGAGF